MRASLRRRLAVSVAIASGLLFSGLLVLHTSQAAFQASTSNAGSGLTSGHLVISDNQNGVAMFSVPGLTPGATGTKCIDVTYSGNLDAVVRLSADYNASAGGPGTALAPYLDFTIDQIATTSACQPASPAIRNAFLPADTTLKAKVDGLKAEQADLGWAPTANSNETRRYRLTYTLQDTNAAMGKTASVGFTWVARTMLDTVTAPGTYQTILGCSANWKPDCTVPTLTDPDGDDIYTWQTTAIPAGTWQTKVAIGGTWGLNYGAGGVRDGSNISFTVPSGGGTVKFSFNSPTHTLSVTVS